MIMEFVLVFIYGFCITMLLVALYGAFTGKISRETYTPEEYVDSEKAHLITDFRKLKQLSELERADRISRVDKKD